MSEAKANRNTFQNGLPEQSEVLQTDIAGHSSPKKRGPGRPRKIVDVKRVIELASKGLIQEEIAAFENVSVDTLTRHFAESLKKGANLCNASLRAKQVDVALKGNPIMLVWLGKNLLNQADKQEIDVRKQMTVRMVVGIEKNELDKLTNGYLLDAESKELPENTSNEASIITQKADASS